MIKEMTQEEYEKYDTYLYTIKDIEVRDKEIERLNKELEFEKLKNKEVREYSNRIIESDYYTYLEKEKARHILEILDKENI